MRTQMIETTSREIAETECPWAAEIVEVEGGYMCFESMSDYETWAGQE